MKNLLNIQDKFSGSISDIVAAHYFSVGSSFDESKKQTQNLRKRKSKLHILTKHQYEILNSYFDRDPLWSKDTVTAAAEELGLSRNKIMKWGSDKKRNIVKKMKKISHTQKNFCYEKLSTSMPNCDDKDSQMACYNSESEDSYTTEDYNKKVDELLDMCQSSTNKEMSNYLKKDEAITVKLKTLN